MEAIVGLMICILIFRVASLPQLNLTHRLLNGFKFILVPPENLIEEMVTKIQKRKPISSVTKNKKSKSGKTEETENNLETLEDVCEFLRLDTRKLRQSTLMLMYMFPSLDTCFNLLLASIFTWAYTLLYEIFLPNGIVVGIATMVMICCAITPIICLLIHWKRAEGTTTSDGFYSILAAIIAFVFSSIILVLPISYTGFELDKLTFDTATQFHTFVEMFGYKNIGTVKDYQYYSEFPLLIFLSTCCSCLTLAFSLPTMRMSFNFVYAHIVASKFYLTLLYTEPFLLILNSLLFLAPIYIRFFQSPFFMPCRKDSDLIHGKDCNGLLPEEWSSFMPFDESTILTIQLTNFLLCISIRMILYGWHMRFFLESGTIHALERELRVPAKNLQAERIKNVFAFRWKSFAFVASQYLLPLFFMISLFLLHGHQGRSFTIIKHHFFHRNNETSLNEDGNVCNEMNYTMGKCNAESPYTNGTTIVDLVDKGGFENIKTAIVACQQFVLISPSVYRSVLNYLIFWSSTTYMMQYIIGAATWIFKLGAEGN